MIIPITEDLLKDVIAVNRTYLALLGVESEPRGWGESVVEEHNRVRKEFNRAYARALSEALEEAIEAGEREGTMTNGNE